MPGTAGSEDPGKPTAAGGEERSLGDAGIASVAGGGGGSTGREVSDQDIGADPSDGEVWGGPERRAGSRAVLEQRFVEAMLRAGEALGEMSGQPLLAEVPELRRYTAAEVLDFAGGPEAVVVAVYVGISGPLEGHALLLLGPEDARRLAGLLLEGAPSPDAVEGTGADIFTTDPLARSALEETGNVVIANFLTAFAPADLRDAIHPSVPQSVVDMVGAILDGILVTLSQSMETFLVARTTFHGGGVRINLTLLVLPRTETLPSFSQPDATHPI